MTHSLSFARRRDDDKLVLWAPECPADYVEANELGAGYARELVALMRAGGNPAMLGAVVRWMDHDREEDRGVRVGFFHELGRQLAS